jgi:hypothetical protein
MNQGAIWIMSAGEDRMLRVALIAITLATLSSPTFAQEGANEGGRRGVCRDDVQKLCAGVERGNGGIRQCLLSQKDKLSDECRQRVESRAQ